jgi:TRAP transporter 4TM/12TM fusion protein
MSTTNNNISATYESPLKQKSLTELFVYVLAATFFIFVLWFSYTRSIPQKQFSIIVLGVHMFLWGLLQAEKTEWATFSDKLVKMGFTIFALLSVVPTAYFSINYFEVSRRPGFFPFIDIAMGAILIGLVLIGVFVVSRVVAIVSITGLTYAYFGDLFPGFLNHGGLSLRRIITMNTAEMSGIFGSFLVIGATWVLMFMYIAGFLESYGGMAKIVHGASDLVQNSRYLRIGQVGVLASMAMGSINGSIAANVATTGSFTIPVMKSNEYPAPFAGAIEAVASSGGQILPPIMGAAVFVMATFIEPGYSDIIIAAVFPAILFYLTVAFAIQVRADKFDIQEGFEGADNSDSILKSIMLNYEYIGAFGILIYALAYLKISPMYAGMYTLIALIGLKFLTAAYQKSPVRESTSNSLSEFGRKTLEGTRSGLEFSLDLLIMFVALAMVVRAFVVTGLSIRLSTNLVILAGGSLLLTLVFAMLASLLFGMAVSTTPAYLLAAILVAPALTDVGFSPLVAHFYVFMFAVAAGITPPIAVGIVIATGIADSDFLTTALEAMKIGFPMLLLPYTIVLHPELLTPGLETFPLFVTILAGLISFVLAFNGYFRYSLPYYWRVFFFAGGLICLIVPAVSLIAGIATMAIIGAILVHHSIGFNWALSKIA